ncbi:MAG: TlpA disulfide reductase family protein [Isosphaeraceae bacterium]
MGVRHRLVLSALTLAVWSPMVRGEDGTPGARMAAIEAAQTGSRERFGKELQQANRIESAQKAATDRFLGELQRNVEAALALARDNPGDPAAFEALKFVIRTNRAGPGDGSARAMRMILERGYTREPRQDGAYLATAALVLFQYPDAERLLRRVLDENPDREARAAACTWLAEHLLQQAKMVRRLRANPEEAKLYEKYTAATPIGTFLKTKDPDALDRQAEAILQRVVAEFADVTLPDAKRTLGDTARGELYRLQNLNVGQVAPEIEGRDHEGKPFRLSETRGKVVVLTFSGNWCGPCVGMYPQERELVSRYRGKPFALVSVNTDDKVETLRKAIASGEITWRCWWESGSEGPITTRWGIISFPTIFVLDPAGVIRFKDHRGQDLDRVVAQLMKEAQSAAKPH